ncbi:MAG: hypothetical protein DU429_04945 [Candidatus Tokpelaia sp.]|nr:MAG: hypothetical protein DU430_00935 [Candidatus Tokpelaia sp.]KAA6206969.1 MAG: hypothetical protein DU429_04945 [Candidatus Tokpelaia sp.]
MSLSRQGRKIKPHRRVKRHAASPPIGRPWIMLKNAPVRETLSRRVAKRKLFRLTAKIIAG